MNPNFMGADAVLLIASILRVEQLKVIGVGADIGDVVIGGDSYNR